MQAYALTGGTMFNAIQGLSQKERWIVFAALTLVALGKIWTIFVYGPLFLGDNSGFIDAARDILSGTSWLHDAGLERHATPPTLWRPIGYSLVIAGAQLLSIEYWPVLVCALQAALSLLAGIMLFTLCRSAGMSVTWATIVFVFYQWSAPLSTDALIMEDALTGAIGMISFLLILRPICKNEIPSSMSFIAAGCAAALCFAIRDVYHFIMPVFGVVALFCISGIAGFKRGIAAALGLVLPVFLLVTVLQAWNEHRTGTAITTTAGQTAYLYGVLKAARHDARLLDQTGTVSETIRDINKTYEYVDTRAINSALFKDHNMDSVAQAEYFSSLYWGTLLSSPVPMIKAALERIRFIQQATLFAGPVTRIDDLDWWRGGATAEAFYNHGWRAEAKAFRQSLDPRDLTFEVAFHLGIRALSRILGAMLFVVFFLAPLIRLLCRSSARTGPWSAAVVIWGVYVLWVCVYIPISFEVRYLTPVIGPALFVVALALSQYANQYNRLFWWRSQ